LFGFRNTNHFFLRPLEFNERMAPTEGDEWIRPTARAAAAPDISPNPWTEVVSPRALLLSGSNVQLVQAADGKAHATFYRGLTARPVVLAKTYEPGRVIAFPP
jgi:hypothetical protein